MTRAWHVRCSHISGPDGGDGKPVPQVPQVHALGSRGAGVIGVNRLVCQLAAVVVTRPSAAEQRSNTRGSNGGFNSCNGAEDGMRTADR
jgi:hypothetical protein